MVGFGKFLQEVSTQYGVAKHSFNYKQMKEELAAIVDKHCRNGDDSLRKVRDTERFDSTDDASSSSPPESGSPASPSALSSDTEARNSSSCEFVEKLEDELYRVNGIVKQKLNALQRVRKVLDVARAVRGTRSAQEHSIVCMQLSNVYDDVILVLWFMYLNSIAVSKLVKKYNKNMPQNKYTIDPSRWLFLRAGLAFAQKAKASIEAEFAACADSSPGQSETLLAQSSPEIAELSKGMKVLMQEYRHHLFRHGDPTDWAVVPQLPSTNKQKALRSAHMAEDYIKIDDPNFNSEYELGHVVGRGAYGVVCKATHKETGTLMAVKTVYDAWAHPILSQRSYREIQIMQQLCHPNIMPLHDLFINPNRKDAHLIMPFIPHTCEDLLAKRQLLAQHKKWFMLQLLSALAYIHSRGVVHRDLKLSNILIDDQPTLYLSDFGLARTLSSGTHTTTFDNPDYVQTQWYRAPEVLLCSRKTTPASDMWSTGCILAELLTGVPLFPGQDDQQQLELIIACCPVPRHSALNDEVRRHLQVGAGSQEPVSSSSAAAAGSVANADGATTGAPSSNGNGLACSSNGETDTCGASGRSERSSGGLPAEDGSGGLLGGAPSRKTPTATNNLLVPASPDILEHIQQVQVTADSGGLRRGSRNFLPKRNIEDVVAGCWKLGVQEEFDRGLVMDLLKGMLQFEPLERSTSAQALSHEWFRESDTLPNSSIIEAKAAALPKYSEEQVVLKLPCTHLHTAAAYREALKSGPRVSVTRSEQKKKLVMHAAASQIQQFVRWRMCGGPRPLRVAKSPASVSSRRAARGTANDRTQRSQRHASVASARGQVGNRKTGKSDVHTITGCDLGCGCPLM
eukprot:Rhum_TRINITY_DN14239_c0_g1::Rhum_TRINITY_DN14239_c0_g1_i1::g.75518::m.75518/K19603/MAPK15; mitogen-activated protein kinase 15